MSAEFVNDFPALSGSGNAGMVYLDSAATTLKPRGVIEAVSWFLGEGTSAVHRGVHARSLDATDRFESTRDRLGRWMEADADEVVFLSGATAAINLVCRGMPGIQRVAITAMEHHSNFVPWMADHDTSVIPVSAEGRLDLGCVEKHLREGVDLLAVTHISNVLGTENDLAQIVPMAKRYGAKILVDAAQSASHCPPSFRGLGIDFLVCSAHKMLGPSGAGALIARREHLAEMRPAVLGGNMVDQVGVDRLTFQNGPARFEAGTPAIESIIGWGAALEYLETIGKDRLSRHLQELTGRLFDGLGELRGLRVFGPPANERGPLVSFQLENLEATAVAKILSQRDSIYVRSGFHCAQPLHECMGISPTVRASVQIYNTPRDIERIVTVLKSLSLLAGL